MKITTRTIVLTGLILSITLNSVVFFDVQPFLLRMTIVFIGVLFYPGFLVILLTGAPTKTGTLVLYSVGVSVFVAMFLGLCLNWLLPVFAISKPLSAVPFIIAFDLLMIMLFIGVSKQRCSILITGTKNSFGQMLLHIMPCLFIISAVAGAIVLNNNGSNIYTITTQIAIGVYVLVIVFYKVLFKKSLNYPLIIFLLSVSLVLMYSMRSWYILGFDINKEYQVFRSTLAIQYWDISHNRNPYYACLSITLLPTILASLLHTNDMYIFKLMMQVLFGFTPVAIYYICCNYIDDVLAFFGAFFFMIQAQFLNQMPTLVRQEVAFLFFGLLLVTLFDTSLKSNTRKLLLLTFGIGMIVSHYSTSYIALILLIGVFVLIILLRTLNKTVSKSFLFTFSQILRKRIDTKTRISLNMLLIFIIFTFLWNSQITASTKNVSDTVVKTVSNMNNIFSSELKSESAKQILFRSSKFTTTDVTEYYKERTTSSKKYFEKELDEQKRKSIKKYAITPSYSDILQISPNTYPIYVAFHQVLPLVIKLAILIGMIYLIFVTLKQSRMNIELLAMSLISTVLMFLILLLPYISTSYNPERLYQQILIVLSLSAVCGAFHMFVFFSQRWKLILMCVLFIIYYVQTVGLVDFYVFKLPSIAISNSSENYDRFYTHETEIAALNWFDQNRVPETVTHFDRYSDLKANAFTTIPEEEIRLDILPTTIGKRTYVFGSYTNLSKGKTYAYFKGTVLGFNFPSEFLEESKNAIYTNSKARIFR